MELTNFQHLEESLEVAQNGDWVSNPYSGKKVWLEPMAVAVFDYVKGCELVGDAEGMRLGIDWFIEHYPKAYMVLLD